MPARWPRLVLPSLALGVMGNLGACGRRAPPADTRASDATPSASPASRAGANVGTPCGPLACTQYDSSTEAFLQALQPTLQPSGGEPRVIAVGEAHAPKGATVPSAARRFSSDILPLLAGRASDLLVELMMPPGACRDAAAEARKKEEPIAARQAPADQNEYVAMGEHARALGIVPDLLRPTCADIDALAVAGDDRVDVWLTTIARLTRAQGGKLLERLLGQEHAGLAGPAQALVLYGGALHNDLDPAPDVARWSYAPDLDAKAGGRFVSVDLVVPEFIGDDKTWRSLPWWPAYHRGRLGSKATVFQTGKKSFVLVFPVTGDGGANGETPGASGPPGR